MLMVRISSWYTDSYLKYSLLISIPLLKTAASIGLGSHPVAKEDIYLANILDRIKFILQAWVEKPGTKKTDLAARAAVIIANGLPDKP